MEIHKDVGFSFATGQGTAGVAAAAIDTTTRAVRGIVIIPDTANTGVIYAGPAGVTTGTGCRVPLSGLTIPVDGPWTVYLIASGAGQGYSYMIN